MNCWLNGSLVDIEQARIDPRDRGLLLGDGIFETLLAENGAVRHLDRHLARLNAAAKLLSIPVAYGDDEIKSALGRLLDKHRTALRITLTRGVAARGLAPAENSQPTLMITAAPAPAPLAQMRVVVATHIRNEKSVTSRIKSLNYLDNILARGEAVQAGVDEAIMCNSAGHIACASAANIFVVRDQVVFTPALQDGALDGIIRGLVIEAAGALGMPLRQAHIARADMLAADEIFLTSSLIGVCPVVALAGRAMVAGQITKALRQRVSTMD